MCVPVYRQQKYMNIYRETLYEYIIFFLGWNSMYTYFRAIENIIQVILSWQLELHECVSCAIVCAITNISSTLCAKYLHWFSFFSTCFYLAFIVSIIFDVIQRALKIKKLYFQFLLQIFTHTHTHTERKRLYYFYLLSKCIYTLYMHKWIVRLKPSKFQCQLLWWWWDNEWDWTISYTLWTNESTFFSIQNPMHTNINCYSIFRIKEKKRIQNSPKFVF